MIELKGKKVIVTGGAMGTCVKNYKGRKGYIHSTSENESKK